MAASSLVLRQPPAADLQVERAFFRPFPCLQCGHWRSHSEFILSPRCVNSARHVFRARGESPEWRAAVQRVDHMVEGGSGP